MTRLIMIAFATLAAAAVGADEAKTLVFVGCPIIRNTTLPCWLGESGGELYYLGPQGDLTADFYPPQFMHKMLVEGVVTALPRICGGVVLKPLKVSVLPDIDVSCNIMLPAEGYADPPNHRGSGPSGKRGESLPPPPRPAPVQFAPPFASRTFVVPFDADGERFWRGALTAIESAARFASTANASKIEITGHRAVIRLGNGQDFVENADIAETRAKTVEQGIRTLNLPASTHIQVTWNEHPVRRIGLDSSSEAQTVSIRVIP